MKNANPEYTFDNVILIESTFMRNEKVDHTSPEYANLLEIKVENSYSGNNLYVIVTANINTGVGDQIDVKSSVKMLGQFTKNSDVNDVDLKTFAVVNAPAIIFPFIREHIASVSSKGGIPTILLPPINFVKMAEDENRLAEAK